MKNPYDVIRAKEQEMLKVRKEVEVLRMAARLLSSEEPGAANADGPTKMSRVVEMP